ncbi:MAG: hypothetical protein JSR18_04610 [Proteobacteria bacterium]|nr:hypothetical protein [Pseudomonadota bacterium]
MDLDDIYSKTEKGVHELKTRQMNLPVQLRSILIMVDGLHSVAQIVARSQALAVGPDVFEQLEKLGLIERRFGTRATAPGESAAPREDDVQRFLTLQKSMNQVIGDHLGLRGYGLMLRLQRANSLRDIHEMLPDLAQALVKRIGLERATPIVEALEATLRG